ncbi:hypothetical protein TWF281_006736 [Arthrobotrys megalospora]
MTSFLNLPREIRDEIYSYLLHFNVSPDPEHQIRSFPWERFDRLGLELSILRVNRQIHDEAAQILYGRNVFPLRICVEGSGFRDNHDHWFAVSYETLWEEIEYNCRLGGGGRKENPNDQPNLWFKKITDSRFNMQPAPRYRRLLRRFAVSVRDYRAIHWVEELPSSEDSTRRNAMVLRSILEPLDHRLASLVTDESQILDLDITIQRCVYAENYPFLAVYGPRALDESFFRQLVYLVWPLTNGQRTYRLKMASEQDGIECLFERVKEEAFRQCSLEPRRSEAGTAEFKIHHVNQDPTHTLQNCVKSLPGDRFLMVATWHMDPLGDSNS